MKPILFNTEMVKSTLDDKKTATRRAIKGYALEHLELDTDGSVIGIYDQHKGCVRPIVDYAPYRPSDILYVRETWTALLGSYLYKADQKPGMKNPGKWHPSIHMPKEAARLFLRVTDVRVERLQDIDFEGCKAEGIWDDYKTYSEKYHENLARMAYPRCFSELWDSTIKKADLTRYGWAANPWVWVIEFERIGKEEALKGGAE